MPSTLYKRILFRVEGNDHVGHGHFMRCLTIARYLQNDFECIFAMSSVSDWVISQLNEHNLSVIDLPNREQFHPDDPRSNEPWNCDVAGILQPSDVMILDGYRFDSSFYKAAQHIGSKTICIVDDLGRRVDCDAIITQLPIAHSEVQSKFGISKAWTGLDGFLVRREFYAAHPTAVPIRYDFIIYVTTAESLDFYLQLPRLQGRKVFAITSSTYSNRCQKLGWQVGQQMSAEDMARKMIESENAILPASSIALEYMVATKSSPYTMILAENQSELHDTFCDAKMWKPVNRLNEAKKRSLRIDNEPSTHFINWISQMTLSR